jgi:hypothetical protein
MAASGAAALPLELLRQGTSLTAQHAGQDPNLAAGAGLIGGAAAYTKALQAASAASGVGGKTLAALGAAGKFSPYLLAAQAVVDPVSALLHNPQTGKTSFNFGKNMEGNLEYALTPAPGESVVEHGLRSAGSGITRPVTTGMSIGYGAAQTRKALQDAINQVGFLPTMRYFLTGKIR